VDVLLVLARLLGHRLNFFDVFVFQVFHLYLVGNDGLAFGLLQIQQLSGEGRTYFLRAWF
jgi:lipoprotein signal peptidase